MLGIPLIIFILYVFTCCCNILIFLWALIKYVPFIHRPAGRLVGHWIFDWLIFFLKLEHLQGRIENGGTGSARDCRTCPDGPSRLAAWPRLIRRREMRVWHSLWASAAHVATPPLAPLASSRAEKVLKPSASEESVRIPERGQPP